MQQLSDVRMDMHHLHRKGAKLISYTITISPKRGDGQTTHDHCIQAGVRTMDSARSRVVLMIVVAL